MRLHDVPVKPERPWSSAFTIDDLVQISNYLRMQDIIPHGSTVVFPDTYAARYLRGTMPTTGVETLRVGDVTF